MLDFCLHKEAIGSEQHFCSINDRFSWVDDVPDSCWVFNHRPKISCWCLNTLFQLNGFELCFDVPLPHVSSFKTILKNDFKFEDVAWKQALPSDVYKRCLQNLIECIRSGAEGVSAEYLERTFLPGSRVFGALEHAMVDVKKLDRYLLGEESVSNKSILESFRPVAGSFARLPVYDRFGTRTGRLTVTSGPEILILKRDYRDIITSSYKNGKIFYVDYSALEARTLLSANGRKVDSSDIYEELTQKHWNGKHARKVIKLATLALIYGSSVEPIQRLLGVSKKETSDFIEKIRDIFGVEKLRQQLYTEWVENKKKIRNFYGRVIPVPEEQTLVNSYVQSTGADVALLGFLGIVDYVKKTNMEVRPLFLLHDALIIDVHPGCFGRLDELTECGNAIPGFENRFFLHVEELVYTS